jgi:hypothetical protein
MCPHVCKNLLVSFQFVLVILDLLANGANQVRIMSDLGAQAVLSLVGQMTMMLILHPTLQAQSDEQTYDDGKEMQKEILDAAQLSVWYVDVEHKCPPS